MTTWKTWHRAGGVGILAVLAACKGSSTASTVPEAAIRWGDAGRAVLVVGAASFEVPSGDLRIGATPPVDHDAEGTRFSYAIEGDRVRVVYLVGDELWPARPGDVHAPKAPDRLAALGDLFANAGARRGELVTVVKQKLGEPALVRMLEEAADVDAPEWDAAHAALPGERAAEVQRALAATLEPGAKVSGMTRAVSLVPLEPLAKTPGFASRAAEPRVWHEAPRAGAVMLRALANADASRAADIGCEVAARVGSPDAGAADDGEGRELLAEAAAIAVAKAKKACPAVAGLLRDPCSPSVRCAGGKPLSGRETSKQDEALCTPDELAAELGRELARAPREVVAAKSGTRVALFAYGALAAAGVPLPERFALAHARRRYTLTQPASPSCDEAEVGKACRCDEAVVRDQACRNEGGGTVRVGLCAFEVDDKGKRLTNVVASPPP